MTIEISEPITPFPGPRSASTAIGRTGAKSLFGPFVDFFALGGISFLVVPVFLMLPESAQPTVAILSFAIANFLNHPHFAHSYQIFYRGIIGKLSDKDVPVQFRLRYLFAGFAVPAALALFLVINFLREDVATLGLAGNLMGFLVGWHYVKQGYGMMIVQSVLKKQFLSDKEKKIFLVNSYACWIFSWLLLNYLIAQRNTWGVEHLVLAVDILWVYIAAAVALASTVMAAVTLVSKPWDRQLPIPWAGIVAYGVTLYVWLFAALSPLLILIVPALHSLQYLLVVWRFELNYERGRAVGPAIRASSLANTALKRFSIFVGVGIVLGYLGFWALPYFLESRLVMNEQIFSSGILLFMCWIFINVHHYFIDNVIWRRENPETRKYLFAG